MKQRLKELDCERAFAISFLTAPAGAITALICNPVGVRFAAAFAPMAASALCESGSVG
jgi:hypothetical protein